MTQEKSFDEMFPELKDRADRLEYERGSGFDYYYHHSIVAENCLSKQRVKEAISKCNPKHWLLKELGLQ